MSNQKHDDEPIITIKDSKQATEHQNPNATQHNQNAAHNNDGLPDFIMKAHPILVNCPHCHHSGLTKCDAKVGILQWLLCMAVLSCTPCRGRGTGS